LKLLPNQDFYNKAKVMKKLLILILILVSTGVYAQEIAPGVYWVYFRDKDGSAYSIDLPEEFLSERSVQRRALQGLAVDHTDRPVNETYVHEIKAMGVEIRHVSRWLNGVVMTDLDSAGFLEVLEKDFTDTIPWEALTDDVYFPPKNGSPRFDPPLESAPGFDYGIAWDQVIQISVDKLHELGFTGGGVWIGVLDAGFYNVDSLPSFIKLLDEGRILETRNYVNDSSIYREMNSHGMSVLSIMGGEWEENMVGTAPHASYLLCMTEDPEQETRIEEIAWIEAAEYADSLGVDVLNTSLGYSDFDGENYDYNYRDMDGRSTFISRAASLTASRGIFLCTSAGNQGNDDWYYITAPGDATNMLTVGAVSSNNLLANFSSRGPSFDARIKPDVTAMGQGSGIQHRGGGLTRSNGTSFSSPLMAGSVAALWQAFPELPVRELIHMIRQSGHQSMNPDSNYGFGTPNMMHAYHSITSIPESLDRSGMELWPNPAQDHIMIRIPDPGDQEIRIYDLNGRIVHSLQLHLPGKMELPHTLRSGIYIIEIRSTGSIYRSRLVKH